MRVNTMSAGSNNDNNNKRCLLMFLGLCLLFSYDCYCSSSSCLLLTDLFFNLFWLTEEFITLLRITSNIRPRMGEHRLEVMVYLWHLFHHLKLCNLVNELLCMYSFTALLGK